MNDTATDTKVARLHEKMNPETLAKIEVSDSIGGVRLVDVQQVIEFAKMLAVGDQGVPPHLRGKQGFCFVICMQAIEWKMSPMAVANKSYIVNDRVAYEAQLIHGVIAKRAPIQGRVRFKYTGEGPTRQCMCYALPIGEQDPVDYTTPMIKDIKIQNSPLWKNDPDQQLSYYAVRGLARRHFPDVILGIYNDDEIDATSAPLPTSSSPKLVERMAERTIGEDRPGFNHSEVHKTIDATVAEDPAKPPERPAESAIVEGVQRSAAFIRIKAVIDSSADSEKLEEWWKDNAKARVKDVKGDELGELAALLANKLAALKQGEPTNLQAG